MLRIWNRSRVINKIFIGKTVGIHQGSGFVSVVITDNMVGHCFGEFALTKKFTQKWESTWRKTSSMKRKSKKKK